MQTIEDLVAASEAAGPPAPDRDRSESAGVWAAEYDDYARLSEDVRERYAHYLDLRYGDDPRQILDVYVPKGVGESAPVFLFFHGGALQEGHPRRYGFIGAPYLARGVVYVSAGYRLLSDDLQERRDAVERELGGFVHALAGETPPAVTAIREEVAQAGVHAAEDGRAAVAWVHRHIAAFGGDPDRITISGHSSGAMITVATAVATNWQQAEGVPADVVKGMVPVGGRYGLWLANAVIQGGDIVDPPHDWRIDRPVRSVVVYGEEEYDGDGVPENPDRVKDCAIIGGSLIAALRAAGADVVDGGLSPRGHWQTLRSLADESDRTLPAVLDVMGLPR